MVPTTATIYATNNSNNTYSPNATSLIDFIIPLPPSCTTITTSTTTSTITNNYNNNNIINSTTTSTTTNCATMTTTIITNSSYHNNNITTTTNNNQNFFVNQINNNNNNSNHNSLRGNSNNHHNSLAASSAVVAQSVGNLAMATTAGNLSTSSTNLVGGLVSNSTPPSSSPLPISRPPSIPPTALIMEPQTQVIHLQATKTLPGANNSSNDDDDDIIGEEVRPAPVETEDVRLRILHAVLFDHTYVNPMPVELPTSFAVQLPPSTNSSTSVNANAAATGHSQQWSLGGIGAVAAAGATQQAYNHYGTQCKYYI